MADNQETPGTPQLTNTPGTTTENESNPASPVKSLKNWFRGKAQQQQQQQQPAQAFEFLAAFSQSIGETFSSVKSLVTNG